MPRFSKQEREITELITMAELLALPALMSDTGHIFYRAAGLREEIRKVHERRQIDA